MIILIGGKARSGKDFMANIMKSYDYKPVSFAKHLKDITSQKYSIDRDLFDTQEGKSSKMFGKDLRQYLIDTAKDIRTRNNTYFVERVINEILLDTNTVITDFRYPEEFECIAKAFPEEDIRTIKLIRETQLDINDPSEKSLDNFNFDYTLDNPTSDDIIMFIEEELY